MRRLNAVIFALMMATLSLAGCFGGDDIDDSNETTDDVLSDWEVYHVATGTDLPNCNSDTLGRLYYVADTTNFEVCLTSGWSFIDIKGADGMQGEVGETGPQGGAGADGMQGEVGETGPQGQTGPSGQAANESMLFDLDAQLLALNQDMMAILGNISSIDSELGTVDNVIQMYYTNFIQLQNQINSLNSALLNATTCQIGPFGNCANSNLDGMDLSYMDLTGINLEGASLIGTNFKGAQLNHSNLAGVKAWNASFSNANIIDADLSGATFWKMEYNSGCNLCHMTATFDGASLRDSDLSKTDLTSANLSTTYFYDADFSGATMSYVNIQNSYLVRASITDANLNYANLTGTEIHDIDFSNTVMMYADLTGVTMYNVDLSESFLFYSDMSTIPGAIHNSTFSNCDLSHARMDSMNLTGVIFYGTNLIFTSLESAIIQDAFFGLNSWHQSIWVDGAVYDHDPMMGPCELGPYANCAGADLSHMNLSGMDLTGIDLRGANLQNAIFDYATLDKADLSSTVAMNATFIHTGMNNTYLRNVEFNRGGCPGGYCGAANLSNAHLRNADLTNAMLTNVDLTNAAIPNADLTDANLINANLTDALLFFANLNNADLIQANLNNANLYDADLTDATLFAVDLTNADLTLADLTNAGLNGADLTNAILDSATVTNADFSNTIWSNTIWTDGVAYNTNQA